MTSSAILSTCNLYRYRLERPDPAGVFASGRIVAFIMVNPSTADHQDDDQTIRKLLGFSAQHGLGRIIVGNKFAWRAQDITDLRSASDAIGPENDRHLEQILRDADRHVMAWGRLSKLPPALRRRWVDVVAIARRVGCTLECLGTAQDGHPLHPLTLGYAREIYPWQAPTGERP